MLRELLPQVERIRQSRLLQIVRNERGTLSIADTPPTKSAGFYWIYTSYSQPELEGTRGADCQGAVNIGLLARLHCGLSKTCDIRQEGFRLVYNGIASRGTGLRERIHQHFNGGKGTGSLAILRTNLSDLGRWRISYATVETPAGKPDIQEVYADVAEHVERMWRLEYGWPILCTK